MTGFAEQPSARPQFAVSQKTCSNFCTYSNLASPLSGSVEHGGAVN